MKINEKIKGEKRTSFKGMKVQNPYFVLAGGKEKRKMKQRKETFTFKHLNIFGADRIFECLNLSSKEPKFKH